MGNSWNIFFEDTSLAAKQLLDWQFVDTRSPTPLIARITETEAYLQDDPAAHTFRGKTPRNAPMFGEPGHLYVYLSYGLHYCVNITSNLAGVGEGILIRAVQIIEGAEQASRILNRKIQKGDLVNGPGLVGRLFGFDLTWNNYSIFNNELPLHLELSPKPSSNIQELPRVGISQNKEALLRFRTITERRD